MQTEHQQSVEEAREAAYWRYLGFYGRPVVPGDTEGSRIAQEHQREGFLAGYDAALHERMAEVERLRALRHAVWMYCVEEGFGNHSASCPVDTDAACTCDLSPLMQALEAAP